MVGIGFRRFELCKMSESDDPSRDTFHLPAPPVEVRDVCRAGDTVLPAMITDGSVRESRQIAMIALVIRLRT